MLLFLIFLACFTLLFVLSRELTRSISLILYRITRNQKATIKIFHVLFLPGVLIHELSHLITAEVLFVKTYGLSLSPENFGSELRMGSVKIEKTDPVRRTIIGFAPVFVGFVIIFLANYILLSEASIVGSFFSFVLLFIIVFEIGNTMFSSRKDLDGTIGLLLFFALVLIILSILGYRFEGVLNFINSFNAQEILQKGIKVLMVPILIDLIIILIAKILIRRKINTISI